MKPDGETRRWGDKEMGRQGVRTTPAIKHFLRAANEASAKESGSHYAKTPYSSAITSFFITSPSSTVA